MKLRWYGDRRDLVKWSAVFKLAEDSGIEHLVYAGYVSPVDERPSPVLPVVWKHFRRLDGYGALGRAAGYHVQVVDEAFGAHRRKSYRQAVMRDIHRCPFSKLLLLDPDTGLQPKRASLSHVTLEDLSEFWEALQEGDWLCLYQHARRGKNWREDVRQELQLGFGPRDLRVTYWRKVAWDAALFSLLR